MSGIGTAGQIEVPAEKERDVVLTSESIPAQRVPRGTVPLDQVAPSLTNPRTTFDPDALDELAASIRTHGLIEPIVVRPNGAGWMLVAGERRWRAAALAGLQEIPAIIREDLDDAAAMKIQIVENLQRQDLDPIEEASGYRMLAEQLSMTQEAIAAAVGRSRASIGHALRLLELPADVQQRIQAGELSVAHGKALVRFAKWPQLCSAIAEMAVTQSLPSKTLEGHFDSYGGGLHPGPLVRAGVLVELREDGEMKQRLSKAGIQVFGHSYWSYTPDVELYKAAVDHIEAEMEQERTTRVEETLQRVQEERAAAVSESTTALSPLVKLEDLPTGSYVHLGKPGAVYNAPAGCGSDCHCRLEAIDRDGEVVIVSTDPAHIETLQRAASRREGKERKAQNKQKREELDRLLAAAEDFDTRGLAILAFNAINRARKAVRTRLIEHHCGGIIDPSISETYEYNRPPFYKDLVTLSSSNLVRIIIEAQMLGEMDQTLEYGYAPSQTLAWYIEEAPTPNVEPEHMATSAPTPVADRSGATTPDTGMSSVQARRKAWSYLRKHGYSITKNRSLDNVLEGELLAALKGHWDAQAEPGWDWPSIIAALRANPDGVELSATLAELDASKAAIAAARTEAVG